MKLELQRRRCGIPLDPQPDWSLDDLISELNALEIKQNVLNWDSRRSSKIQHHMRGLSHQRDIKQNRASYVMLVTEDEAEETQDPDEDNFGHSMTRSGAHFSCRGLELSDSSEDEYGAERIGTCLMDKAAHAESILLESRRESQLRIEDEIRGKLSVLEANLRSESARSTAALVQVEKYMNARKEADRRHNKQYQRRIAEELDNHLSAIQRDHEQLSLIEERKIRADAASEEARRKEKVLYEEKARQEIAKAEATARVRVAKAAEEVKKEVLESERRVAEEVKKEVLKYERKAAEEVKKNLLEVDGKAAEEAKATAQNVGRNTAKGGAEGQGTGIHENLKADDSKSVKPKPAPVVETRSSGTQLSLPLTEWREGSNIKASKIALNLEEERLVAYNKMVEMNNAYNPEARKDFKIYERQIAKLVKQISGAQDHFWKTTNDLLNIFNASGCPQSLSLWVFAKQVVSLCDTQVLSLDSNAFACARVIVLITSKFPVAMDLVLAEFHRACIYTVPKHIQYSESQFFSKEDYFKTIGYRDEDGIIESKAQYLERVNAYMTLYAAIIQTEMPNIRNLHGLEEGWAWIARLLNALPADSSSGTALLAFLKMAGFAMFRKYRSQFRKVVDAISNEFLAMLKSVQDPKLNPVIESIDTYIESNQFLLEPKWR